MAFSAQRRGGVSKETSRVVVGFWEREKGTKNRGKMLLLPLLSACAGEEESLWCRSQRHRLLFFFWEKHETALF